MAFDFSSLTGNKKFMQFGGEVLQDLGYGLSTGTNFGNALGNATQRMQQMQPYRDQQREKTEAEAKAEEMRQRYAETLSGWGGEYADLAEGVLAGGLEPADAYMTAWQRRYAPQGTSDTLKSVGGHLYDTASGQWISPPESGPSLPAAPSGYQWNPDGTQAFIPGGPADPATQNSSKPPTDAQRRAMQLSSVVEPEAAVLFGQDGQSGTFEALANLGNQAMSAEVPFFGGQPGYAATAPEFQQATRALETIAQSYLYAISGQAAPAEEVKKIVASVTPQPFESPASVADKKRRVQTYVEAIRMAAQGADMGGAQSPPMANGGTLSNGVQWSIGQ